MSGGSSARRTVVALAGRRIDAPDSRECRFPESNIDKVRADLASLFRNENVDFLICSAACGADLLALDVAVKAKIHCRVILPFPIEKFKTLSVVDRPGNWGPLFDEIIDRIPKSDLITLDSRLDAADAYMLVTREIVRQASQAAAPGTAIAVAVWEGRERANVDATAAFLRLAGVAGMARRDIRTC